MRDQEKMAALNRNTLTIGAIRDITCVHHIPFTYGFLEQYGINFFLAKVLLNAFY